MFDCAALVTCCSTCTHSSDLSDRAAPQINEVLGTGIVTGKIFAPTVYFNTITNTWTAYNSREGQWWKVKGACLGFGGQFATANIDLTGYADTKA